MGKSNDILKIVLVFLREWRRDDETDRGLCNQYSGFSEPGIIFRDVTSVLQDADGLRLAIDLMQEKLKVLSLT